MSTWSQFRVWPQHSALPSAHGRGAVIPFVVGVVVLGGVLALPPVARAIGIPGLASVILLATQLACFFINVTLLMPRAAHDRAAFHASIAFALVYNYGTCLAFVVLTHDPLTMWWMAPLLYATLIGALDQDPSLVHAAVFLLGPLALIPVFAARGTSLEAAVAGGAITGMLSVLAYNETALNGARSRAERERLRRQIAELEHARLARDLHDGVGSALSVLGIYADLVERALDDRDELARIAGDLRSAAREGMSELRGVLDALGPERADVATLARTLRTIGARAGGAVAVNLAVTGDTGAEVVPRLRLAIVRVFQEALANAIRHGGAQVLDVELAAREGALELAIRDDGCGFDPAAIGRGRGLANMRQRAEELGGTLALESARGQGTRIQLRAPA